MNHNRKRGTNHMKIIPLFDDFTNNFNKFCGKLLNPLSLETNIKNIGDSFTIKLYEEFLNQLDEKFKNSKERKQNYNIKETTIKTLITSIGTIKVHSTAYYHKQSKERFVPLRDILNLKPYQRLTNEAEYQLIKYAMEFNMTQSGKNALRHNIIHRSTVSRKMKVLDVSIKEEISKSNSQPKVLYIEMDEIHANLQHGGNKICPCAIVHEGHSDNLSKRKKLKNVRYFASSKLSYEELWEVVYDYVNKKYNIDSFDYIFVSGDGAFGIKNFKNVFPNAIFVLDKFHFRKAFNYIFKKDNSLSEIAESYLRNNNIKDFRYLVKLQISRYPSQEKYMLEKQTYLINNIDGIMNQKHEQYQCPCAMEGHVSNAYARYITSSPYGFSLQGLENKLKLLVYKANKHDLTIEDYYNLKYGINEYTEINNKIKKITNIKYNQKLTSNHSLEYKINTTIPIFDSPSENNRLKELISPRQEIYII